MKHRIEGFVRLPVFHLRKRLFGRRGMTDFHLDGIHLELCFLIDDAGVTSDENGHPTLSLLGMLIGFFDFPDHRFGIVGINDPNIFHPASLHQFFKRKGFTRMPIRRHSGFRSGLHACHGGDGVIQDDENKSCPIIDGIEKPGGSGVIKGGIADRGNNGNPFTILVVSLIEATRKGDGSPHIMAGIDSLQIHSKGIAANIARENPVGKGLLNGEEGSPMRTS